MEIDKKSIRTQIEVLEAKLPTLTADAHHATEAVIVALNAMLYAGPTPEHVKMLRDRLDKLADALSRSQ